MKREKICWRRTHAGFDIELRQAGIDNFTVQYGLQVRMEMDYGAAAAELGRCIMHALACEGKLDNREK